MSSFADWLLRDGLPPDQPSARTIARAGMPAQERRHRDLAALAMLVAAGADTTPTFVHIVTVGSFLAYLIALPIALVMLAWTSLLSVQVSRGRGWPLPVGAVTFMLVFVLLIADDSGGLHDAVRAVLALLQLVAVWRCVAAWIYVQRGGG